MQDLFSVGTRIFIQYADRRGVIKNYRTHIYHRTEEFLVLLAPAERGLLVPIRPKTSLLARHIEGKNAYISELEVTDEYPYDPALVSTTLPECFETTGNRQFFRVNTDLDYQAGRVQGTITNLSGSGMLVCVPAQTYSPSQKVEIQMKLPDSPAFPVQGRVVRIEPGHPDDQVAIMFTRVRDGWQDHIIHYVFRRQGQLIRSQ